MTLDLLETSRAPEILHTRNCHPSAHLWGSVSDHRVLSNDSYKGIFLQIAVCLDSQPWDDLSPSIPEWWRPLCSSEIFFQSPHDLSFDSPVCALKAVLLTSWPGFTVLSIISYGTLYLRKITSASLNLPQMDSNQDVEESQKMKNGRSSKNKVVV